MRSEECLLLGSDLSEVCDLSIASDLNHFILFIWKLFGFWFLICCFCFYNIFTLYGLWSKLIDAILLNELNTNLIYGSLDSPEIFLYEVKKLVCPQHEMCIWIALVCFLAGLFILLPFQAFQITALDVLKTVYLKEIHQLANRQRKQLRLVNIVYQRHTG